MVVNKHKEDLIGGTPGYRSSRVYRVIKRTLCVWYTALPGSFKGHKMGEKSVYTPALSSQTECEYLRHAAFTYSPNFNWSNLQQQLSVKQEWSCIS